MWESLSASFWVQTALILRNSVSSLAYKGSNYQQHFPKDVSSSHCETTRRQGPRQSPSVPLAFIQSPPWMGGCQGLLHPRLVCTGLGAGSAKWSKCSWHCQNSFNIFLLPFGWWCIALALLAMTFLCLYVTLKFQGAWRKSICEKEWQCIGHLLITFSIRTWWSGDG